jgi:hypothetical protein
MHFELLATMVVERAWLKLSVLVLASIRRVTAGVNWQVSFKV